MHARSASTSVCQGNGAYFPVVALDKTPPETGGSDSLSGQHRWLRITAGMVVVAVLAVGTWQVVELHHEVSDLQTQSHSQQTRLKSQLTRLKSQQSQLSLLDAAVSGSTEGASTSLSQIEGQISALQGNTINLAVRIGRVNLALNDATVNPDGSLFVSLRC